MADAQYVVDVAAQMSGGEKTIAQLAQLSADLLAAGVGADHLHDAVAQVSNALAAARDASKAANAALAEGNATFDALETSLLQASKAADKEALKGVVTPETAARVAEATSALEAHAAALKRLEADAAAAAANEKQLGVTLANVKQAEAAATEAIKARTAAEVKAAADQAKAVGAAEAEKAKHLRESEKALAAQDAATRKSVKEAEGFVPAAKTLGDFTDAMSTSEGQSILAAGAFLGVAAAVAAITLALTVAVVALASWAVGLADARRETALAAEAAEIYDPGLKALRGTFSDLSDATGASTADLRKWTKQLEDAKVGSDDLPAALRAVALGEAALGQGEGLSAFLDNLKKTDRSVDAVAADFEEFSGVVEKKMRGLDAQSARFHKNIGDLFGGLNIDPVLDGLQTLVSLFDANTAAGQTMKFLFESVFQPLIDQAQSAAYVIEAFALGFLIGLTKVYIAVKPAIRAVSEFFGFKDSSLTDTLDIAKRAGELIVPVFLVFAGVLASVVGVIALVVAQLVIVQGVIYAFIAAVVYAGATLISALVSAFQRVKDYISGLGGDFSNLGTQLVTGLVNGITGGAASVISAMVGLASGALKAAKDTLGIHSPSTEMYSVGDDTTAGFVNAVDDGHADAQAALSDLVSPPEVQSPLAMQARLGGASAPAGAPAPGGGEAASSGGGTTVIIHPGGVVMQGVPDAKAGVVRFGEWLLDVLEGNAASLGGAAVGGANG